MRKIDLRVPTGWNQCTAEQLEAVTGIILRRTAMQDRYHPYDPVQMKAEAFFALAGLEVIGHTDSTDGTDFNGHTESTESTESSGDAAFTVRFRDRRRWWQRLITSLTSHLLPLTSNRESFPIYVWQVHSFVNQHLGWLDEFTGLQLFPYHDLGHYWRWGGWFWLLRVLPIPTWRRYRLGFDGELLDGMTWQQYRFANEWLNYYVDVNGQIAQQSAKARTAAANSSLFTLHSSLLQARTEFLRAVYRLPDGHYPRQFKRMSPERFQVILIWWQSMMAEMQRKYRRCFKSGSSSHGTASRQQQLPIDLYTRSMATLQDKYHLTEEQINQQPCRVILQHLEDLAHEAEELEKINKRNKSHR